MNKLSLNCNDNLTLAKTKKPEKLEKLELSSLAQLQGGRGIGETCPIDGFGRPKCRSFSL